MDDYSLMLADGVDDNFYVSYDSSAGPGCRIIADDGYVRIRDSILLDGNGKSYASLTYSYLTYDGGFSSGTATDTANYSIRSPDLRILCSELNAICDER